MSEVISFQLQYLAQEKYKNYKKNYNNVHSTFLFLEMQIADPKERDIVKNTSQESLV